MRRFKVIFVIFVISMCIEENLSSFVDLLPISVRRERNMRRSRNFEELPVLDFIGLVKRHSYPVEQYQLTTPDGYKLGIHRIPGSPNWPKVHGKPVVYIQHGILGSSDMFVLQGPGKDLAFLLADAGYDVWLGNGRGNSYSRAHTFLSPDYNPEFWEFSFDEMAMIDVSEMIDFVLSKTGQESLIYVAHSMGTTMGLVLLSSKPEFNKKIHLVVNLATIGYWKNPKNLMKFFYYNGKIVERLLVAFGLYEVLPQTVLNARIINGTCREGTFLQAICKNIVYFISGHNAELLDSNLLSNGLAHFPAGCSRKTLLHYHQNILAGRLQMYDYGLVENYARYRKLSPPTYNLENIEIPVYMIYGNGDKVAPPEDSLDMLKRLRNSHAESVPHKNFGHLDFVWARNIKTLLQDRIMEIIRNSTYIRRAR